MLRKSFLDLRIRSCVESIVEFLNKGESFLMRERVEKVDNNWASQE
jgi:hypothetical protein